MQASTRDLVLRAAVRAHLEADYDGLPDDGASLVIPLEELPPKARLEDTFLVLLQSGGQNPLGTYFVEGSANEFSVSDLSAVEPQTFSEAEVRELSDASSWTEPLE